jgi:diacylglycerol kinase family enzyme
VQPEDIAVIVNLRSRSGSDAVADEVARTLPRARVIRSRSIDDMNAFAASLGGDRPLFLSAGGDGTAVGLLNAVPHDTELNLGVLRLGTGNAWAHATGAPKWRVAVERLASFVRHKEDVPLRHFDLIEVLGQVAHFAGTGWDAEIIDDYHSQPSKGLFGYLRGVATRTVPRHFRASIPEVEVVNTGAPALGIDEAGKPYRLPGGEAGAVLYRGPASVCAAGTNPCWGFGFRAFPFAGVVPGRMCLRIFSGGAWAGLRHARANWRGAHPVPGMHTWLVQSCRATFSRPVPFQAGGDRLGMHESVEYKMADAGVNLVDWGAMA